MLYAAIINQTADTAALVLAVLALLAGIWKKIVVPFARMVTDANEFLPMLNDLPILREIIAQLRSDSGSTIKDSLNRLEALAVTAQAAAEAAAAVGATLRSDAEVMRQMAQHDRERLEVIVRAGLKAELLAAGVAVDLAASKRRADDAVDEEEPGAAADAASQSGDLP